MGISVGSEVKWKKNPRWDGQRNIAFIFMTQMFQPQTTCNCKFISCMTRNSFYCRTNSFPPTTKKFIYMTTKNFVLIIFNVHFYVQEEENYVIERRKGRQWEYRKLHVSLSALNWALKTMKKSKNICTKS